jgi:hypothetical protein
VADLAFDLHIGQKAHGDGAYALAVATRAAAITRVEAETSSSVAACLGFQRFGKQLADGIPKADVGGGATAWGFADGGLVDFQHAIDG